MDQFQLETKPKGTPSKGCVRNIGGAFSIVYVCSSCWEIALEHGCNLDESKDVAKKWKQRGKLWNEEKTEREGPVKAVQKQKELAERRKQCLSEVSKEMI